MTSSLAGRRVGRRALFGAGLGVGVAAAVPGFAPGAAFAQAPAAVTGRPNPIRLSANENPYGPGPRAREAIARGVADSSRYPTGVYQQLLKQLAAFESVPSEAIVIGTGSGEILTMAGLMYGAGGGRIVSADPSFSQLTGYAREMGAAIDFVPLDRSFAHDLAAMDRAVGAGAELVYICNPNNPTGTLLKADDLRAFCRGLKGRAAVFVDEAYLQLTADPKANSMVDLVREGLEVIVARTFSKEHGLAGLRVGYGIAKPDLAKKLSTYRMTTPNMLGLMAASASLDDSEFLALSKRKIAEGREVIYRLCAARKLAYVESAGNFVFFDCGMPVEDFRQKMAAEGLLVGRPYKAYPTWMRVSVGTTQDMAAFATAFEKIMGPA
jgi:histidinol-phosphate aminotransferase